jgi:hypothetical protein
MRFDEYLQQRGITAVPVDRMDGFEVTVEGPQDWEPLEAQPGLRIWVWPQDPYRQQFCANAVLTMHRIAVELDPAEVFSMLSEEQVLVVPGCHVRERASAPAEDSTIGGIQGMLSSQFDSEFGPVDSLSRTRIITADQQTLIAQLTLTALHVSSVDWAGIHLSVVADAAAPDAPVGTGAGPSQITFTPGCER